MRIPQFKIPQFKSIKIKKPKFENKRIAIFAYSSVAIGFILTLFLIVSMTDDTPVFPAPAIYDTKLTYDAGIDTLKTGFKSNTGYQTLRLLIGGTRINNFYFEDIQVGRIGLNTTIKLTGESGNSTNYLICENLIIDGLSAESLIIGEGEVYNLIIEHNRADGNSFSSTFGIVNSINFGSTRGSLDIPYVKNSDFDQIIIDTSNLDSTCKSLTFMNVKSFGAPVELRNFKVGNLIIRNSIIGSGTGIDNPSFIIESSLIVSNLYLINNSEEPIDVR
jgi:hypothetical protein